MSGSGRVTSFNTAFTLYDNVIFVKNIENVTPKLNMYVISLIDTSLKIIFIIII